VALTSYGQSALDIGGRRTYIRLNGQPRVRIATGRELVTNLSTNVLQILSRTFFFKDLSHYTMVHKFKIDLDQAMSDPLHKTLCMTNCAPLALDTCTAGRERVTGLHRVCPLLWRRSWKPMLGQRHHATTSFFTSPKHFNPVKEYEIRKQGKHRFASGARRGFI